MTDVDYMAEDLGQALRDADLGRAWQEAYRLKIALRPQHHVSPEALGELVAGLEALLGRIAGPQQERGDWTPVWPVLRSVELR